MFSYVPIHAPFPHVPMPVQAFRSVSLCHCVPTRSSALRFVLIFSFFPLRSHPRPFSWGFEMFRRVSMCSAAFPCIRLSFTRSNAFSCLVPILSYASSSIIPLRFSRVLLFAISSGAFPALFKRFVAFPCIALHFSEFQYVPLSCNAFSQRSATFPCLISFKFSCRISVTKQQVQNRPINFLFIDLNCLFFTRIYMGFISTAVELFSEVTIWWLIHGRP